MGGRLQGRRLDLLVLASAVIMLVFTALEVREPVFRLGGLGFTTTEVAALFFILAVACWSLFNRREALSRRSLDAAVLLFLASNFLSAAFAEDQPSALKFSLRLTYAALIYFGISRLPGRYRSDMVVAGAVTLTALLVSVAGILQNFFPRMFDWARLLDIFQDEVATFGAFYYVRIASTLPYPTVLSGYLEMTLPLVTAFGLFFVLGTSHPARRRLYLFLTLLAMLVVIACHVYTYTRSSLMIIPASFALGAILAAGFRLGRRVWVLFALGSVLIFLVMGVTAIFDEKIAVRLGLQEAEARYGAGYELVEMPATLGAESEYTAVLKITNTGSMTWNTSPPGKVGLSYRWYGYPGGEEISMPYQLSELPRPVGPGESVEIPAGFRTPDQPGRYLLVFDLVQPWRTWFSAAGAPGLAVPLEFNQAGAGAPFTTGKPASETLAGPAEYQAEPRLKLWRAALNIWREYPLLGIGPDQFRRNYHEYVSDTLPDERHHVHNVYLEALANTGIVGLAAIGYLFARSVLLLWRLIADRRADDSFRVAALGLLVALAAYMGHSLLESFIWQTGVNFLLFAILGLIAWLVKNSAEAQR